MQGFDEDQYEREKRYRQCFERMRRVKIGFIVYRAINVFANAALFVVCILTSLMWFQNAGAAALADSYSEYLSESAELTEKLTFPASAAICFFAPGIIALSIICDNYLRKSSAKIAACIYLFILLFGFSNLIFEYEPMTLKDMVFLLVYGIIGAVSQYMTVRDFDTIEELSHYEGFPDFNYLVDSGNHSKYVRYRESWLKKQRDRDNYDENRRSTAKVSVTDNDNDAAMGTVSLEMPSIDIVETKHTDNMPESEYMDVLEAPLLDNSDYVTEDPRHKPL